MNSNIFNKNWLLVIVFVMGLAACLPNSEFNIQFSGIRSYEFSGNAKAIFCFEDETVSEKYSLIQFLSMSSTDIVEIFLPYNTSVGTHRLSTEVDRARNYTIELKLPSISVREPGTVFYTEADLAQGTITIDHFDKDYSGRMTGSFEAEFNDGLIVEGDFDVSYPHQGNQIVDFSCFANTSVP